MSENLHIDVGSFDLNVQIVKDLVGTHYKSDVPKLSKLYELYKGEHDILNRKITDPTKPNNKLVNNFYSQIVDDIVGYFLGKPVVINYEDKNVQAEIEKILKRNDKDDLFMEIGKEMGIKGRSALLVYQDEFSQTKLVQVPAEEIIVVYDKSRTDEISMAIRVYELEVIKGDEVERIKYAEVYDKQKVTYYIEDEGEFILDTNRKNPVPHIFEAVPIVPFYNNKERMGDFEGVITLVNDYNKRFSDMSNEHEAFRNAYLVLINLIADTETAQKLKEEGIISMDEDGDAKFLTKNIPIEAIKEHLDRLENNIYKFAQVPNLSDEKFANNLSGVAIRFKLFSMENKCITKERKMIKGFNRLLMLLSKPIKVKTGKQIELDKVQYQFTRNVPNNLKELSEVVGNLQGVADKKTLLSLLPFIDNPDAVIEALDAEAEEFNTGLENYHPTNEGGKINEE